MANILALQEDFATPAAGATIATTNTIFDSISGAGTSTANADVYTGTLKSMDLDLVATQRNHRADHTAAAGWRGFAFKIVAATNSSVAIAYWYNGLTKAADLRLLTDNTLQLRDAGGVARYTSPVLTVGQWYYVTVRVDQANHRLKIYTGGATLLADSGALTNAGFSQATVDQFNVGLLSNTTARVRFARIRGDDAVEPATGVTASNPVLSYTRSDRTVIDATASTAPTLIQETGPAVSITGTPVFTVTHPAAFTSDVVLRLTATQGGASLTELITIKAKSSAGYRVFDGTSWVPV